MALTPAAERVLLFGEMEINLTLKRDELYSSVYRICEACGYDLNLNREENYLAIFGEDVIDSESMISRVYFDPKTQAITKIEKRRYSGNGIDTPRKELLEVIPIWQAAGMPEESKEEKEARFKRAAIRCLKQVKFGTEKELPAMQGLAINAVIKEYKIPAVAWGYHHDIIGIETKRQFLFWKDKGGHAEFLGLVSKSELPAKKEAA